MLSKKRFSRQLWNLVLPISCLNCGGESDWLCDDCLSTLALSRPGLCHICGKSGANGLCEKCQKLTKLDGLISLFPYREPIIQKLIKAVKYRGQTDAWQFFNLHFGQEMLSSLPNQAWSLVPIPLSRSRLVERGFNQAQILAQLLGRNRYPICNLLRRTCSTVPQTNLNRTERLKNLRGCFALSNTENLPRNVVLVDDVVTTGSTLKEATKVLRKAGVEEVWALTIAHG